jgi:site-specific DNA recombinase
MSRSLSDAVQLFDRLRFAGMRVIAVAQGIDTHSEQADVLMTVHGLVDSLYVKELAKKRHRGLEGAFLRGLHAGGRCYGYRNVPVEGGGVRLEINDSESEVVRHIFEMSASGMSLKSIAASLNAERVAPPRPKASTKHATWAPTAIREMLRRELYVGRMIWNRSRFVKVPGTNKRVARPRPKDEWQVSDRPELRIISAELWQLVEARQSRMQTLYGGRQGLLNRSASSGHLLRGFVKCGPCGGNLVIVTGRKRRHAMYGCPQHWYRGACSNGLRLRQSELEPQLLSQLQKAVLQPEVIHYMLEQFEHQVKTAKIGRSKEEEQARRRKTELEGQLKRLASAVAEGGHSDSLLAAIGEREQELTKTNDSLRADQRTARSSEELRRFATERLSILPGLLARDVLLARAELSRHVTSITMNPTETQGIRRYTCQGDWNLLGTLDSLGAFGWLRGADLNRRPLGYAI